MSIADNPFSTRKKFEAGRGDENEGDILIWSDRILVELEDLKKRFDQSRDHREQQRKFTPHSVRENDGEKTR